MKMQQCPAGHYYDQDRYTSCNFCMGEASVQQPKEKPVPPPEVPEVKNPIHGTVPDGWGTKDATGGKTVIEEAANIAGWLMCISGPCKGNDYRIRYFNNRIGRNENMEIILRGDQSVSGDRHAIITYDPEAKRFIFSYGSGQGIVRHNGAALLGQNDLAPFDHLKIGNCEFIFVPLCGEHFSWE